MGLVGMAVGGLLSLLGTSVIGGAIGWIVAGAGALITLLSAKGVEFKVPKSDDTDSTLSKIYTFSGIKVTAQEGAQVPVVYGTHKLAGNIIDFVSEDASAPGTNPHIWDDLATDPAFHNDYPYPSGREIQFETDWLDTQVEVKRLEITFTAYYWTNLDVYYAEAGNILTAEKLNFARKKKGEWSVAVELPEMRQWEIKLRWRADLSRHFFATTRITNLSIKAYQANPNYTPGEYHSIVRILLAMCEGEVEGIGDHRFDDQPITNFRNSQEQGGGPLVTVEERYGGDNGVYGRQKILPGYEGTTTASSLSLTLTQDTPQTHSGTISNCNEIRIYLEAPNGIYATNDDHTEYQYWQADIHVEYKLSSSGTWKTFGRIEISGTTRTKLFRWVVLDGLPSGQYDVRVTKTSDDPDSDTTYGEVQWLEVQEIEYGVKIYPGTALTSMRIKAGEEISGKLPNITSVVRGRKIKVPDLQDGGDTKRFQYCYWGSNTSSYYTYNATAVTWDGSTLVEQYSNNPAWCIYDMLTNKRFGLGEHVTSTALDLDSFYETGKYCDTLLTMRYMSGSTEVTGREKQYELDVVIDSGGRALDILERMMNTFNGFLVWQDGKLKLKCDRPGTPVQLFNDGNIIEDTFKIAFQNIHHRPTVTQIQFLNEKKNWEKTVYALEDTDRVLSYGRVVQKFDLWGVTRPTQVARQAKYILNHTLLANRAIEFEAGLDSIHCEVGDVITVSSSVPDWNDGGRVTKATSSQVWLDHEITLGTSGDYQIMCTLSGDDVETRDITSTISGATWDVTTTSAFTEAPTAGTKWIIGRESNISNDYKVVDISLTDKMTRKVSAIQYSDALYTVTGDVVSDLNFNDEEAVGLLPAQVTDLDLLVESDYYAGVLLSWNPPADARGFKGVDLYVKHGPIGVSWTSSWDHWKRTERFVARYTPVRANTRYYFKAVAFNRDMQHASFTGAPFGYVDVTLTGSDAIWVPPNISNLRIKS